MNTVETIRTVIGVFFILFGLGVYAHDETHNTKDLESGYSPISWLICIIAGVFAVALSLERGIYFAIAATILWSVEKVVLLKLDDKKNKIRQSI